MVFLFKGKQTSRRKALSIAEKETFNRAALVKAGVALRLPVVWFIIISCADLLQTSKAKTPFLPFEAGDLRLSRATYPQPQKASGNQPPEVFCCLLAPEPQTSFSLGEMHYAGKGLWHCVHLGRAQQNVWQRCLRTRMRKNPCHIP